MVALNLALIGLGFALFSSPNTNAIMGSVDEQFYGVAASTVSTMRMIGMATSMTIVTLLIALFVGDTELHQTDPVPFPDQLQNRLCSSLVFLRRRCLCLSRQGKCAVFVKIGKHRDRFQKVSPNDFSIFIPLSLGTEWRRAKHPVFAPLLESFLKPVKFLFLVIAEEFTDHPKVVLHHSPYLRLATLADLGQLPVRVPEDLSDFGLLCLCQVKVV